MLLVTDITGHSLGPILNGQAVGMLVFEDWT